MTKLWVLIFDMKILQMRILKAQIMAYTRALVYHKLYDSVAERIKHKASNMLTFREKGSNPVRRSLH